LWDLLFKQTQNRWHRDHLLPAPLSFLAASKTTGKVLISILAIAGNGVEQHIGNDRRTFIPPLHLIPYRAGSGCSGLILFKG
jgi:hypothetical protein